MNLVQLSEKETYCHMAQLPASHSHPFVVTLEAHPWSVAGLAQARVGSQGWSWVGLSVEEEGEVRVYL